MKEFRLVYREHKDGRRVTKLPLTVKQLHLELGKLIADTNYDLSTVEITNKALNEK